MRTFHRRSTSPTARCAGRVAEVADEERAGVRLTNLHQPLFDGAGATKRDLVDYADAMADRIVSAIAGRPLSVMRVRPGQAPFMQKDFSRAKPDWLATATRWAETSHRDVMYALCNDRQTLIWLANQRAVELHPALVRADTPEHLTHLVIDLDPDEAHGFRAAVEVAHVVREVLSDAGLSGVVKTSGAKGLHVFVPVGAELSHDDAAATLRAVSTRIAARAPSIATTAFVKDERQGKVFVDATRAYGSTVVAVYSPRVRPGVPVSMPLAWDDIDSARPSDFTIHTVPAIIGDTDPWADLMPPVQRIPEGLIEEGRAIPVARVAAMHEGKRRKRNAST